MIEQIKLDKLKDEAMANQNRRSRIIITPGYDSIICLHRSSYIRCHRHPEGRHESYHVIEGKLIVMLPADGELLILEPGQIIKIHGYTWHQPLSMTEFTIYHEVFVGPFDKALDIEYAPFARRESA